MMVWSKKHSAFIASAFSLFLAGAAHALPQYDEEEHLGVATCASSVCHGKQTAVTNNNVMLNEYKIWITEDRHANAYKTLLSSESRRIATNMGLPAPAHKSQICLDCHTDNVPKDKRGEEFRIDDGVGCESCHGGAELWLESHTEEGITHAANLKNKMYPTEDGFARAKLCLSCHLGTENKLVTHEIMGAGHPRLFFEMESFTANQPAHYKIDPDYIKRKGEFSGFTMWAVGQLASAKASVELMKIYLVKDHSMFPELVFYDCHSCHHSMSEKRWYATPSTGKVAPGSIRLNLVNLIMLREFTSVVYPKMQTTLSAGIKTLNQASQKNHAELAAALTEISLVIAELETKLRGGVYSNTQMAKVRTRLLSQAAKGEYRDYIVAEQAFYTIEGFTISLKQFDKHQNKLNKLYGILKDEDSFSPAKFKSVARQVKSGFE